MKHIKLLPLLLPVLYLNSSGEFFTQYTVTTGFWKPAGISVFDMNGDGYQDILGAAWNDDEISFWINSGEPTPQWEEHVVDQDLDGAAFCSAGDLNEDGNTDIAACGFFAASVNIYIAQGEDNWNTYTLCSDLTDAHEVHLEDVNDDGLTDCIAAAGGDCSVALWLNNGSTPDTWDRYNVCISMVGGRSVCFGDFDGDGDTDMAGCSLESDDVLWWENSGDPVPEWTEHEIEDFFNGAHMIRACDMNCDGFTDLVCAAFVSGKIGIWYNSGTVPVEWDKQLTAGSFGLALGVEPVDINGDGMPDFAATSMNPDQLAYWLNNGGLLSTWEKTIVDDALLDGWPIGSGDFNGDGRNDLTAGASGAGYIRWYANTAGTGITVSPDSSPVSLHFCNPARSSVDVTLNMTAPGRVSLCVFDLSGRTVSTLYRGTAAAGPSEYLWNGCSEDGTFCGEGVYLIRAESSSGEIIVEKVTLLK